MRLAGVMRARISDPCVPPTSPPGSSLASPAALADASIDPIPDTEATDPGSAPTGADAVWWGVDQGWNLADAGT
jgi:hypothetical protein